MVSKIVKTVFYWGWPSGVVIKFTLAAPGSQARIMDTDLCTAHQAILRLCPTDKIERDSQQMVAQGQSSWAKKKNKKTLLNCFLLSLNPWAHIFLTFCMTNKALQRTNDRKLRLLTLGYFANSCSKLNSDLTTSRKKLIVFMANDEIWAFEQNLEFWNRYICHQMVSQYLKILLADEMCRDISECDILVSYNDVRQHL